MLRGFDASSAQGLIDFSTLDPALRFVVLKAQQGNDGFDPFFARNMRSALAAGLVVFAYAFAYPLPAKSGVFGRDPKEQAKLVVDRIHAFPEMRGRPIFLDLEWPPPNEWPKWGCSAQQISAWCREYVAEIERLSGAMPVLYTYPWWWAEVSKADTSWAARYGLWMADYRAVGRWPSEGARPLVPTPWMDWTFWQFDGDGGLRLPSGDADFCVFNGGEDALRALIRRDDKPMNDFDIVHATPLPERDDPEAA